MPEADNHTLDDARVRYPAREFHPILITDVTRMLHDHFCVAGFDLHEKRMVRPLRRRALHWVFDEWQPAFLPGQVVNARSVIRTDFGLLPHVCEDIIAHDGVDILEQWTDAELFTAMLPQASGSIVQLLGCAPIEHRYLVEGVDCPSLGAVRAERSSAKFLHASNNRVRLAYWDCDRRAYTFPVLFPSGVRRVSRAMETHRVALMCAERDPITCHRSILICRTMRTLTDTILHILEDGETEAQREAERRLMQSLNIVYPDLFNTEDELIEQAYDRQGEKIAYVTSAAAK